MDQDCIQFLQWALPQLEMEWKGFRKVRKQVCKRIKRRMRQLELNDWEDYRLFLEHHKDEWSNLDSFCRITISRFYRDRRLFDYLGEKVIPKLIETFPNEKELSSISIGCASGEEPYTIAIMWKDKIGLSYPEVSLKITALDADTVQLQRAQSARYSSASLKELPQDWKARAFIHESDMYRLKESYKKEVTFIHSDIRTFEIKEPVHLVCCRNLVATYFSIKLQIEIFQKIRGSMPSGAALILGAHEQLPDDVNGFEQDNAVRQIYWAI